jgi:hypothetical protein
MALRIFHSDVSDRLKQLSKGAFSSNEERDRMLKTVLEARDLKPRDVAWVAFSPDRTLLEAAPRLLANMRTLDTVDQFIIEARTRPEAAVRAVVQVLFALNIPGTVATAGT